MQTLKEALFMLVLLPGTLMILLFLLSLIGFAIKAKGFKTSSIPKSLLITSGLLLAVSLLRPDRIQPFWILLVLLIGLLGLLTLKAKIHRQWSALPIALILNGIFYYECSEVKRTFDYEATWVIGSRGSASAGRPEERLVSFVYGDARDHYQEVWSDDWANRLEQAGKLKVKITVAVYYNWGRSNGTQLLAVDDKAIDQNGGAGCSGDCKNLHPNYYFGLKDMP